MAGGPRHGPAMASKQGKTAVVVAQAGSIGAAVSWRLAVEGFAVVLALSDRQAAHDLAAAIRAGDGRAAVAEADNAGAAAMRLVFDAAEQAFGTVDVVASDTDVAQLAPLAGADEAAFQRHVAINLRGVFGGMLEAAARLTQGGRIICIPPTTAFGAVHRRGDLAAIAAGIGVLHRVLASCTEARAVTVNALAFCRSPEPGRISFDTDARPGGVPADIPSFEAPDEMAALGDAIAWLVGPQATSLSGRVLRAGKASS